MNKLTLNLTWIFTVILFFSISAQSPDKSLGPIQELTPEGSFNSFLNQIQSDEPSLQSKNPFARIEEVYSPQADLSKYVRLRMNHDEVYYMFLEAKDNLELSLPTFDGKSVTLNLQKVELFSEGFRVVTSESNGQPVEVQPGIYYRGVLSDDPNSIAAFSIFEDQVIGMVTQNGENTVLHPSETKPNEYILYNDSDVNLGLPFSCETLDHPERGIKTGDNPEAAPASKCVEVYIECDYALYQNKGTKNATINWITAVFNNVATLYSNESIDTKISEIYVWTTPDNYSKTSSVTALNQFRSARRNYNGDLAHLAALGGNNIGGVAWLDVLCSTYGYAYSNINASYRTVPTYSWTVEVFTHEMGHNLGSNHTQWCGWNGGALDDCWATEGGCARGPTPTNGGTIMSYCHLTNHGINFNNGFGTQPGDKIRDEVANAGCLGTACGGGGGGCNTPTGLAASNLTTTSATLSWNSVTGAVSYDLEYKKSTANTWTLVNTTATSTTINGLSSSTKYDARVRTNCSGSSSTYSATISFTTKTAGGGGGYCASKGKDASKEWIRRVRRSGFDRRSGSDGGYYDATNLVGTMNKSTYNVTYFQADRTGSQRTFYWRVWVDLNQDGDFTDAGELRVSGYSRSINLLYAYVYIPSTAKTGKTRMRVSMRYGGYPGPCQEFSRGEVEDYSIEIRDAGVLVGPNGQNEDLSDAIVYPNPTKMNSLIQFQSAEEGEVQFVMTDTYGRTIRSWTHQALQGDNFLELDVNDLSKGNYFIAMRRNGSTKVIKFVKM